MTDGIVARRLRDSFFYRLQQRVQIKTMHWILSAARFVEVSSVSQRFRSLKILAYLWHSEMVARFQQTVAAMLLRHTLDFDTNYKRMGCAYLFD